MVSSESSVKNWWISDPHYTYSGDGDRTSQTVDGVTTHYVIDIAAPLTMVLAETTGADSIYYLHGLDLAAQYDGVSTEYFAYDGLGSVRQVLDEAGSVLFAQTFDPYGNPYASAGTDSASWGFTGEQTDSNGLVFLRARYYDPRQGRFLQRDPWRGDDNKPISFNPWIYASANPIFYIDPSGLYICEHYETCLPNQYLTDDKDQLLQLVADNLGVYFVGPWDDFRDIRASIHALLAVAKRFGSERSFRSTFKTETRPLVLLWGNTHQAFWGIPGSSYCDIESGGCTGGHTRTKDKCGGLPVSLIKFVSFPVRVSPTSRDYTRRRNLVVHELGHLFGATVDGGDPYAAFSTARSNNNSLKRDNPVRGEYYGFAGEYGYFTWQMSYDNASSSNEIFADQFLGWTFEALPFLTGN